MNSRSSALSSDPDTPVINARVFMRPISPRAAQGSGKRPLIPLDDALPAGGFQAAAELRRFIGGPERTYHGAVVDALLAEVGALDQRRARSQHGGELALQGPKGGLCVGLVFLRGDLNQVSAAPSTATWRGLYGVGGRRRAMRRQRDRRIGARVGRRWRASRSSRWRRRGCSRSRRCWFC